MPKPRLPAGPLVEAIDALARTSSLRQVLAAAELKAYSRAKQEGTLTLDAVDRFCDGPLQCSAYELYGEAYDRVVLGEGDHGQVTWLDDFRERAMREGVPLELEPAGQLATVVPAKQLSDRRDLREAVGLADVMVDNLAVVLDASGHGARLRELFGPAALPLLDPNSDLDVEHEIGR